MIYGLADCNNFYCSCERVFHPDLIGRPVVVLSNNDGCIIARSNESKALGLEMGAPFYKARPRLLANGVAVFSSNYNLYGDMSRRVMSMLSRYTPHLDVFSIDEAFLDLEGVAPDLEAYCREIARLVGKGTGIPISIGVAPTRTLAKMASRFAKKYPGYRGVCAIDTPEKRQKALGLTDVADVWGIGRRSAAKLKGAGIFTAADLTLKSASWVKANLALPGLRTWKELHGIDCLETAELPHKHSICTSRSFPGRGCDSLGDVEEAVANFAAECCRKLRAQRTACGALSVFAYTSRFGSVVPGDYMQGQARFDVHTSALSEIVGAAVSAMRSQWRDCGYFYKKAGVILWDIVPASCVQGSLFDTVDRQKSARLMSAIDEVNRLNGHNAVRMAVQGYSKRWHLKNEFLSRRYTTDINEIITIKA